MAWSPAGVIPNLPGGRSPHNIPIPITPIGGLNTLPGQHQQAGGGYYLQPHQPQHQMHQPQHQMYGQLPQAAPAGYQQAYVSPYQSPIQLQQPIIQVQQPMGMYSQNGYMMAGGHGMGMYPGQVRERPKLREDNPPLDKYLDGAFCTLTSSSSI